MMTTRVVDPTNPIPPPPPPPPTAVNPTRKSAKLEYPTHAFTQNLIIIHIRCTSYVL